MGPSRLAIAATLAMGVTIGLGAFTFVYARGYSYLTNDPAACANCHIMDEHYSAWMKSSHRGVAACNDCHTPHSFVGKYVTKVRNGFWHSFYFTTGRYPDPLRITADNRRITEGACRDCHEDIVDAISGGHAGGAEPVSVTDVNASRRQWSCVRCHAHVGHYVR
jgi:cytochrome c nitrite reductase small subunit